MILRAAVAYALVELASAILNGTDKPKPRVKRKKHGPTTLPT